MAGEVTGSGALSATGGCHRGRCSPPSPAPPGEPSRGGMRGITLAIGACEDSGAGCDWDWGWVCDRACDSGGGWRGGVSSSPSCSCLSGCGGDLWSSVDSLVSILCSGASAGGSAPARSGLDSEPAPPIEESGGTGRPGGERDAGAAACCFTSDSGGTGE